MRETGEHLLAGLRGLMERHRIIGDVRGIGLMAAIELVRDRETKEPAREERNAILRRAFEAGLTLLPAGESAIRFSPPLTIRPAEIDTGLRILDRAMEGY